MQLKGRGSCGAVRSRLPRGLGNLVGQRANSGRVYSGGTAINDDFTFRR
jgi:hypothetical protein